MRPSHRILITGMSLHLIVGPMFSGKSTDILGIVRKYNAYCWPVLVITHVIDTRYSTGQPELCTHNKERYPAHATDTLVSVRSLPQYQTAKVVIIEEAQFFTGLQEFVLQAVEKEYKIVYCVGLDGDTQRCSFGEILNLVPFCDSIEKRHAFCKQCDEPTPALFTARAADAPHKTQQIEVGGANTYEPLCRRHYLERMHTPSH